jgi:hypothetical protein
MKPRFSTAPALHSVRAVISIARTFPLVTLSICLVAAGAPRVWAQDPATPEPAASAAPSSPAPVQDDDDDAVLDPAEPDYTVINLPTTMVLPKHKSNFRLTHRFNGNLRNGTFSQNAGNLFGLDQGAVIAFEYRYAPIRFAEVVFHRSAYAKTIQFSGKYDAIRPSASWPIAISALVSVEGTDNFHQQYATAVGAVLSSRVGGRFAAYASPVWVDNTTAAIANAPTQDTLFLGLAGRARVFGTTYLVGELTPRLNGYAPDQMEYGFGIEKRVGGHMFSLTFTNTDATTFSQIARGGAAHTLYLGFNLGRKFY